MASATHSAAAIERTMGNLNEDERAKILGLNAARVFKFEIPAGDFQADEDFHIEFRNCSTRNIKKGATQTCIRANIRTRRRAKKPHEYAISGILCP